MARDDLFEVRSTSLPKLGEGTAQRAIVGSYGAQVVVDQLTHWILAGYGFHMQIGTEDAPVNSTTSIDDALVWMLADNQAGSVMVPLLYELNLDFVDTAVNIDAMLELDKDKVRYSSGGTAFVPANLRSDDLESAGGSFYVGTDITAAAKSAVPNSVELARKSITEDAVTDPATGKMAWDPAVYNIRTRPPAFLIDASSILCHFGAGTADANGYGVLQFAQFPKASL